MKKGTGCPVPSCFSLACRRNERTFCSGPFVSSPTPALAPIGCLHKKRKSSARPSSKHESFPGAWRPMHQATAAGRVRTTRVSRPGTLVMATSPSCSSTVRLTMAGPRPRRRLPARLREDRDTAEVCNALGISEESLFVRVHRARRQLLSWRPPGRFKSSLPDRRPARKNASPCAAADVRRRPASGRGGRATAPTRCAAFRRRRDFGRRCGGTRVACSGRR